VVPWSMPIVEISSRSITRERSWLLMRVWEFSVRVCR
jgi:hypothetical protein